MATVRARELYNDIAFDYSAIKTNPFKRWIEETTFLNAILRHNNNVNGVKNMKDVSILDLGCGSGHFCRLMSQEHGVKSIYGIDVSDEMIKEAKRIETSGPTLGIQYYRSDLLADNDNDNEDIIPKKKLLGGSTVDLCASAYLFPYASTVEELRKFCCAAANALRPGGRFVSVTTILTKTLQTATGCGVAESKTWGFSIVWDDETEQHNDGPTRDDGMLADVTLFGSKERTERVTFPNMFWSKDTITTTLLDVGFDTVEWLPHEVDERKAPPEVVTEFRNKDISVLDAVGYCVATKKQ